MPKSNIYYRNLLIIALFSFILLLVMRASNLVVSIVLIISDFKIFYIISMAVTIPNAVGSILAFTKCKEWPLKFKLMRWISIISFIIDAGAYAMYFIEDVGRVYMLILLILADAFTLPLLITSCESAF